jgi:hypothetical protein
VVDITVIDSEMSPNTDSTANNAEPTDTEE